MEYYWYKRPTSSAPRAVAGGIKAQNKRGAFGQTWWGKEWITTLENFDIGERITRGKSYARKGQVTDLVITAKKGVAAKVQGSRVRPYKVSITLTPYSKEQKELLAQKLTSKPIYIAQLLSGEMPENLARVFKTAGLALFPAKYNDLTTTCSCPDYSNPCKHIAAVVYLMAEAFDQDPFLLFTLRGIDKEEFLRKIGYKRQTATGDDPPGNTGTSSLRTCRILGIFAFSRTIMHSSFTSSTGYHAKTTWLNSLLALLHKLFKRHGNNVQPCYSFGRKTDRQTESRAGKSPFRKP